jgi:hypothetical protein
MNVSTGSTPGPDAHQKLVNAFAQLFAGVLACYQQKLITPALILLYCGIDIAAWLWVRQDSTPVGRRFIDWTGKYLLPRSTLECHAVDLYGARCGLVHTFGAASDLSASGRARKVVYAWGTSTVETLAEASSFGDMSTLFVAIQFEDLLEGFGKGIAAFLEDLKGNPTRAKRAYQRADGFFVTMQDADVEDLLNKARDLLGPELYQKTLRRPPKRHR